MRIGIITLFVTVCVSFPRPALCQDQPSGPLSAALRFFDQAASSDLDSTLRGLRKAPLSSEERDLTRAMLPREKADDQRRPRGSVTVQFRTRSMRVTEGCGTTSPNRNRCPSGDMS